MIAVYVHVCIHSCINNFVGVVRCGYWIAIAFGVVFLISDVALWLAVLGYTVENGKWHITRNVLSCGSSSSVM